MRILLLLILAFLFSACTNTQAPPKPKTMKAFTSDEELKRYIQQLAENRKHLDATDRGTLDTFLLADSPSFFTLPDLQESVTNTQHEGVDEGGIVKVHGSHLVILRRGRLFTVAIGDDKLNPVSTVDTFAPRI